MKRLLVVVVSILLLPLQIWGYEVINVKEGATLKGTIRFSGSVPPDEVIRIDRDVEVCGKEKAAKKYIISKDRIRNAVVWLEGVKKGKVITPKMVEVTVRGCEVEPLVNVGFVGGRFIFKNDDPILHTLQLKLGLEYHKVVSQRPLKDGATIYNIALPRKGIKVEKPIKDYHAYSDQRGFIKVTSNAHPWLRGYIFIFDHPYVAVTDNDGSFVIDNIPPGEYKLMNWHEGFGIKKRDIILKGGRVEDVEIDLSQ